MISSAGPAEFALESSAWKNGVFTYALLEQLRMTPGPLRVRALRERVIAKVKALTQGRQKPTSRRESVEFDFDVF